MLLCEIYGSTESCPHVFVPPEKCAEWNGAWSGVPFAGIEVKVIDEAGNERCPGAPRARILPRAPHVRGVPERARPHRPRAG
ncbi:MAG: hypothetical protein ACLTDR_00210 [Adlercreutzia equolifaciens]